MKTIQENCTPRQSIFETNNQDFALNLTDLIQNKIDAQQFIAENFKTAGMDALLKNAFERFAGNSQVSLIKLTQAMGGGKTHNMVALGLLAKNPQLRSEVMDGNSFEQPVRVAAFSGRESDAPLGIWGAIAEQIGKQEEFNNYYSPLQAPGETAWINLLKGEPLLILLDELPPYFEVAAAKTIGNSDLAVVTTAALANLIVAVNKAELSNVLIVISDLKATYGKGSGQLNDALKNLDNEVGRTALNLEPVRLNSNEIYNILRTKIFEKTGSEEEIKHIADGYSAALKKAKTTGLININPEDIATQIKHSYPFHPAIKDLYARFKENPGFQQTRGLIRLLRTVTADIYSDARRAEKIYLLAPYHFNLNHTDTVSQINQIKPSLATAVSHDIASGGNAVAELVDQEAGDDTSRAVATLLLISSLSDVPNGVKGLSEPEILTYLCEPDRDLSRIKNTILPNIKASAWYLHIDTAGTYLFKDTQNIVARLNTIVQTYNQEASLKKLSERLNELFAPQVADCYQNIQILKGVDEIQISPEKVSLIIYRPYSGGGLHPDLQTFFDNQTHKNRVLFLTGERTGMDSLFKQANYIKGIESIIEELSKDNVPQRDPQFIEAQNLQETYQMKFYSAARETFTKLYYPTATQLMEAEFSMNFTDNNYSGEEQIRALLESKQKFTTDIESDTFRRKCEDRLFTSRAMPWNEIKKRAAQNPAWQWHNPGALERLKNKLLQRDIWRTQGSHFIDKGPFPPPETSLSISQTTRNPETGIVTLRLTPQNGDTVYYDRGATATTSSIKVTDLSRFQAEDMRLSFLCVDSTGKNPTGPAVEWKNSIEVKYRTFQNSNGLMVELKAIPAAAIKYTTNGSNPADLGASYDEPFPLARKALLLAVAEKDGVTSQLLRVEIAPTEAEVFRVDPDKPLLLKKQYSKTTTREVFEFLEILRQTGAMVQGGSIYVKPLPEDPQKWLDLTFPKKIRLSVEQMEELIDLLRARAADNESETEVSIPQIDSLWFANGSRFEEFQNLVREEFEQTEIEQ